MIIGILLSGIIAVSAVNTGETPTLNAVIAPKPEYEQTAPDEPMPTETAIVTASPEVTSFVSAAPQPTPTVPQKEIELVSRTLSGECYEEENNDKRAVAMVICNRASVGGFFGSTIEQVVTKPKQFYGYWNPSRAVSESDIAIATEILAEWYANGQIEFADGYLYFSGNGGKVNKFRREF
jgi:hypothetical protein